METLDDFLTTPVNRTNETAKLKVDFIVQNCLFGIALLGAAIGQFAITFFAIYFCIGAYQLITSFVHLQYKNHSTARMLYWPQLVVHAFSFLSLTWVKDGVDVLIIIIFTTGFSALYYYFLTVTEYVRKTR